MRTAIYPGSFNPWHQGHDDILGKALKLFDRVYIAVGINPSKQHDHKQAYQALIERFGQRHDVSIVIYNGLLAEFVHCTMGATPDAVVKGLRNSQDFEHERTQQYWNEDLGIKIPTVYFITDRNLTHISSSAIRNGRQV